MKKLLSILLTLMMILGLAANVLAEDTVSAEEDAILTIDDGSADASTTRVYAGYKLLGLTTSLKTGELTLNMLVTTRTIATTTRTP